MAAYYNEIDAYAAEWLRNLIKAGHIADGEVDTRSIVDVQPDELREFTQCHFFAGIAGWSHALRLAGWEDERQIWTGSCPCQPFSVAGQGKGVNDERHLWPHFFRLIRCCRPSVVMGEQVAGAAGYGWLDGVRFDLESESYSCEGVDIPACSVNAPHIRSRLYWVAMDNTQSERLEGWVNNTAKPSIETRDGDTGSTGCDTFDMADTIGFGRNINSGSSWSGEFKIAGNGENIKSIYMAVTDINGHDGAQGHEAVQGSDGKNDGISVGGGGDVCGDVGNSYSAECETRILFRSRTETRPERAAQSGSHVNMADTQSEQLRGGHAGEFISPSSSNEGETWERQWVRADAGADGVFIANDMANSASEGLEGATRSSSQRRGDGSSGNSYWDNAIWLNGADGKTRRAQPDICLLANGVPARVGKLRAYGNAIVPPLAAEVIKAFMETL